MPKFDCADSPQLAAGVADSYRRAAQALNDAGIRYVVGGAYALAQHTGVVRHTKDFDIFLRPADRDRALSVLTGLGYRTEIVFPFWLAKGFAGEDMIDLIYRAPNGLVEVTDQWLDRAIPSRMFDVSVPLCAPEEILLTKLFVLNNDRNDLADVMHLFYSCLEEIDWDHLLRSLGKHWRVLLAHLVFFGYVYPSENHRVPRKVMRELTGRLEQETESASDEAPVCYGPLFSFSQYTIDLASGRFEDGRLQPHGRMTRRELFDSLISLDDPNRAKLLQAAQLEDEAGQASPG